MDWADEIGSDLVEAYESQFPKAMASGIAAALRKARNDALEEAAEETFFAISSHSLVGIGPKVSRKWLLELVKATQTAIRSLKEPPASGQT